MKKIKEETKKFNTSFDLIKKIKGTITGTRFENKVFVAGGFVRDYFLNVENKDIDIVVELPNGGIELAKFLSKELDGTTVVIFERFGTAQTVINGIELEFVMTRTEKYNHGDRKPIVAFGTTYEDCKRRDFTINSMLLNVTTNEVIDFFNGKNDLKNGIIKTTSNPQIIFEEDPLRLIRCVRFATKYNFNIEEKTFKEIALHAEKLNNISRERIRDEFIKILMLDNFDIGLLLLMKTNLIKPIGLPEISSKSFEDFNLIINTIKRINNTLNHRLAALLYVISESNSDSHKIAVRFLESLKMSNIDIKSILIVIENFDKIKINIQAKEIRKLRYNLGEKEFKFLIDLVETHSLIINNTLLLHSIILAKKILSEENQITNNSLLINGNELMNIFKLKEGKEIGDLITKELELMFENPNITKEQIIKKLINEYKRI